MSITFVRTERGFVNIAHIQRADLNKRAAGHGFSIFMGDQIVDDNNIELLNTVVSVVPVQGEWECLTACPGDDGVVVAVTPEPVLSWGLRADGSLIPMTPSSMKGIDCHYALRRKGDSLVYSERHLEGYQDQDEWIAAEGKYF